MLAPQLALPHVGHLDAVFWVSSYLKAKHNSRLDLDMSYLELDNNVPDPDWSSIYRHVKEAKPLDAPTVHGKEVDICIFVDSDHAGDKFACCSHTGFFIFLHSMLIMWESKK